MICATFSIKITFVNEETPSSSVLRSSKTNKRKQYRGNKINIRNNQNKKYKTKTKTKEQDIAKCHIGVGLQQ